MAVNFILPDTNILILGFKDEYPFNEFLRDIIKSRKLVFSTVVIAEFLAGATVEQEKIFNGLVERFKVLPVDLAVAQLAAFYRKQSLEKGKKIDLPDCFIAATAKIYRATLATLNKKDYPMREIKIIDRF